MDRSDPLPTYDREVAANQPGTAIVRRARACIGARFRAQGRDPATGLDCVGLAAVALGRDSAPRDYAMRSGDVATVARMIGDAGMTPVDTPRAGDLILLRAGPGQLHIAIRSEDGIIHADGAAGRVVERPGAPPWPVVGVWRQAEGRR